MAGGALLAAGGVALWLKPDSGADAVAQATRRVLRAVLPVLLAGALPGAPAARELAIEAGLQRTVAAIAGMPPAVQTEIAELMTLLDARVGRWLAGIDDWNSADPARVAAFLQRWRQHRFDLLQAAYHALHDLALGPYYADPVAWEVIGYPGPIRL